MDDRLTVNRASWDDRAPLHAESADYAVEEFVADPERLSGVVRFDLARLGDVGGLRVAHLQCHIGTDTLSLVRLGARVTGLDFSPASLAEARRLAERTGTEIDYVESDVYDAPEALGRNGFDLVYTGIGALCWLPDIARWADTVAALLVPGGRLFLREGHPVLWSLDETVPDDLCVRFAYFETPDPLVWEDDTSYVPTSRPLTATTTHEWNHGLGEIVTALFDSGFTLTGLTEHASVPYDALPGRMTPGDDGEYRLTERPERLPLSYTLQAVGPG